MNIARGLQGGINDTTGFPRWLDDNLFEHATFKSLLFARRPRVWINASDIYNRTPFVFGRTGVRGAVQRSCGLPDCAGRGGIGAVPVIFAPVVIQNYPGGCPLPLPDWVQQVRNVPNAAPLLKLYADALERYHSGEVRYVKLLDGGLVDNYGLAAFTIARLVADTAYGPLEPEEAVKCGGCYFWWSIPAARLRAHGRRPSTVPRHQSGHRGIRYRDRIRRGRKLFGVRGYDEQMAGDADQLALPSFAGRSPPLRRAGGMNCRDVRLYLARLSFDQLGPERASALNASRRASSCRRTRSTCSFRRP